MYQDINQYVSKNDLVEHNFLEAKRAYNAGVYKSSLIILWTCIVLDVLEKSKRLNDYNSKAKEMNNKLDYIKLDLSSSKDKELKSGIKSMLDLENSILEFARDDLKIISHRGFIELKRVKDDRNACAHPSFVNDQYFSPSQSLVRSHIDSAWEYLISNDTLNGDYLNEQIKVLINPEKTLVWRGEKTYGNLFNETNINNWDVKTFENSVSLLAGKIMLGGEGWGYKNRCFEMIDFLHEKFPSKVYDSFTKLMDKPKAEDAESILLKISLSFGHWDGLWSEFLKNDQLEIIQEFFNRIEEEKYLNSLLENNFGMVGISSFAPVKIRESFNKVVENLNADNLINILRATRNHEFYIERFTQLVEECCSYDDGNILMRNSVNIINSCDSSKRLAVIIRKFAKNEQMYGSYKTPGNIKILYQDIIGRNKNLFKRIVNYITPDKDFTYAKYSGFLLD